MDPEQGKKITVCHLILSIGEENASVGNLYLGAVGSLKPEIIQHFQISAVLSVMDSYMYEKKNVKERIKQLEIKEYKWIDLQDNDQQDIQVHFESCFDFIQQCLKKHNVLVHCQAGISRSATIIIFYVMKKLNLSLQMANKLVVSKRHYVSPNQGFWNSLKKFDQLKQQSPKKEQKGINDPHSQFRTEKYPQKFANHILCVQNQGVLEKGNLFLGQFSILKSHFIKSLHIKSIASVVDESYYKRMKIKESIEHMGIDNHLWLNVKDDPQENLAAFFDVSFEFIENNIKNGNVLVHCQAGVSRSASVVIAYLIRKFKVDFPNALRFVQQKRKVVNPNQGFQLSLVEYSEKIISN